MWLANFPRLQPIQKASSIAETAIPVCKLTCICLMAHGCVMCVRGGAWESLSLLNNNLPT